MNRRICIVLAFLSVLSCFVSAKVVCSREYDGRMVDGECFWLEGDKYFNITEVSNFTYSDGVFQYSGLDGAFNISTSISSKTGKEYGVSGISNLVAQGNIIKGQSWKFGQLLDVSNVVKAAKNNFGTVQFRIQGKIPDNVTVEWLDLEKAGFTLDYTNDGVIVNNITWQNMVNLDPTVGYTSIGGSTDYWNNRIRATCFNASEDGTAINITWYIATCTSGHKFNMSWALYNRSASSTYNFMAKTDHYILNSCPFTGWVSMPLMENKSIYQNAMYCIAQQDNQTSGGIYQRWAFTTNASWHYFYTGATAWETWTNPITSRTTGTEMISAYLGYYAATGGTPANVSILGFWSNESSVLQGSPVDLTVKLSDTNQSYWGYWYNGTLKDVGTGADGNNTYTWSDTSSLFGNYSIVAYTNMSNGYSINSTTVWVNFYTTTTTTTTTTTLLPQFTSFIANETNVYSGNPLQITAGLQAGAYSIDKWGFRYNGIEGNRSLAVNGTNSLIFTTTGIIGNFSLVGWVNDTQNGISWSNTTTSPLWVNIYTTTTSATTTTTLLPIGDDSIIRSGSGGIQIIPKVKRLTFNIANLTMRRPDGAYVCCGPNNSNQWVCASGVCG